MVPTGRLTEKALFAMRQEEAMRHNEKMRQGRENKAAHEFWDTQPVPKLHEEGEHTGYGPIDAPKTPADVKQEPYALPQGFEWCTVDVNDDKQIDEVYHLLTDNYVEDDDNTFRFDYSREFLRWALVPPDLISDWLVGVRTLKGKLVGFITGVPAHVSVGPDGGSETTQVSMAEINFLCVHKKLRSKRLAPVLIKEVTRRVNMTDRWQAVYTAGVVLPRPVASCRYWHRSLNPKKLVECGFSYLGPRMSLAMAIKLYRLPEKTKHIFKPIEQKDIKQVTNLLNEHLKEYKLKQIFSEADVKHWLSYQDKVVYTFVKHSEGKDPKVTDFFSFYSLPSTVLGQGSDKHKTIFAAYNYYSVATTMDIKELIQEALISAKNEGFDVYNCLDLMRNGEVLKDLKFGQGDGKLQYYLYNYACPTCKPGDIGLILL